MSQTPNLKLSVSASARASVTGRERCVGRPKNAPHTAHSRQQRRAACSRWSDRCGSQQPAHSMNVFGGGGKSFSGRLIGKNFFGKPLGGPTLYFSMVADFFRQVTTSAVAVHSRLRGHLRLVRCLLRFYSGRPLGVPTPELTCRVSLLCQEHRHHLENHSRHAQHRGRRYGGERRRQVTGGAR